MVGWMFRMDGDNYGKLLVYNFQTGNYLWSGTDRVQDQPEHGHSPATQPLDQRGSRVYRGNLLVIPMGNSILYVEPCTCRRIAANCLN